MTYTGLELFMENLKQLIYSKDNPLINKHPSILSERPRLQLLHEELCSTIQILFDCEHTELHELEKVGYLKRSLKHTADEAQDTIDLFISGVHFRKKGYSPRSDVFRTFLDLDHVMRSIRSIKAEFMTMNVNKMKIDSFQRTESQPMQSTAAAAAAAAGTSSNRSTLLGSKISFHGHELKRVKRPKRRMEDTAKEAQDIIGLFVSREHFWNKRHSPSRRSGYTTILALNHFMRPIKTDSSQRTISQQMWCPAAGTSNSSTLGSKILSDEIVVGLDHHVEVIRDKLVEDQRQLDVVSILGMGGLGKTTLATKVFNDRFIMHHFDTRAWVTVSQTYKKRDVLIHILASLGVKEDMEKTSDSKLREMLHKWLKRRRYLIVIDDIWSKEAWDNLKVLLPDDDTSSRILLTSRLNEVGLHAKLKPNGLVHFLSYLTKEQSWELLCKKVFHGKQCPEWLSKHGIQIANKCQGLPLSVVLVAGLLAKEPENIDLWEKISCSVGSYIASDENKHTETLALSYDHLPLHLKDCFLYLGGFPEDFKFPARWLIGLWMAEGFIQEAENQSLEDIGEAYLLDLVGRNLVIVEERRSNGAVNSFKVHDLMRELCLRIAQEERFFLRISAACYAHSEVITSYKIRRLFTYHNTPIVNFAHPPIPSIRSLVYFDTSKCVLINTAECFRSFVLLRVLDLRDCEYLLIPEGISLLVHLRYLAIWHSLGFPSSLLNLTSLQTLIVKTSQRSLLLPSNISDLVNLRHLWTNKKFYLPSINRPMNLQTISEAELGNFQKYFPVIKKISLILNLDEGNDFEVLLYLESFKLTGINRRKPTEPELPKVEPNFAKNQITFPATLKTLTLVTCHLPWSYMAIIQSLPNLEVLKVKDNAFDGPLWSTGGGEEQFQRLRFLRLERLNFVQWEACSINFPCLIKLEIVQCYGLEEIPLEIGDIPTLELINIEGRSSSIVKSLEIIQEEQRDVGNYDLQILVDGMELSMLGMGRSNVVLSYKAMHHESIMSDDSDPSEPDLPDLSDSDSHSDEVNIQEYIAALKPGGWMTR